MVNQSLNVFLNNEKVGVLRKSKNYVLTFSYHESWMHNQNARPISLSMPLFGKNFSNEIVYNFFDNLLPDNQDIRGLIQKKFNTKTNQPFDLLYSIGGDCIGAIQLCHEGFVPQKKIIAKPVTDTEIANILKGYKEYPLGMNVNTDFRISIAGAQQKTAFLYHNNKWNMPLEATPTTHIFKLPIGFIQNQKIDLSTSCENEWLCGKILKEFGLEVAESEIKYFDDTKALVVKRFDRKISYDKSYILRLPQEDMCQVFGISPNLKYQADGGPSILQIMKFLSKSDNAEKDKYNFFKVQIIFYLLAAIDGHAKNYSVFITKGGRYRLTPFYDVMSVYPLINKKQLNIEKIKMAMSFKGKKNYYNWSSISKRHFFNTAKEINYDTNLVIKIINEVLENVENVINVLNKNMPDNIPNEIYEPIFEGIINAKKIFD